MFSFLHHVVDVLIGETMRIENQSFVHVVGRRWRWLAEIRIFRSLFLRCCCLIRSFLIIRRFEGGQRSSRDQRQSERKTSKSSVRVVLLGLYFGFKFFIASCPEICVVKSTDGWASFSFFAPFLPPFGDFGGDGDRLLPLLADEARLPFFGVPT